MEAVIYTRVSTAEQARSGLSLEEQARRCRAYCDMRGFHVVGEFADPGISGGRPLSDRPGGSFVVANTSGRDPRALHVVALKLDRCFRNAEDALAQTREWNERGVSLHLVDWGGSAIDTSSALGRMFLTLLAGFAEFERAQILERTMIGREAKRAAGGFVGGAPPFGWRNHHGLLVEVPEEQYTIREVIRLRGTGLAYSAVAEEIAGDGHTMRNGSSNWTASRVSRLYRANTKEESREDQGDGRGGRKGRRARKRA